MHVAAADSILPRRILFFAEGQLGDLLLLTPALRAVKQSFPQARVAVFVLERRNADTEKPDPFRNLAASERERTASAISSNPNVDELLVLSREALRRLKGIKRLKAELAVIGALKAYRFDAAICTFPEDRFALWSFATGARVRIGQRRQGLSALLTHKPDIEKRELGVLRYYCRLAEELGAVVQSLHTEFYVAQNDMNWGDACLHESGLLGKRFVVVHPGASGDYKIWPPERFASLLNRFANEFSQNVLLLQGPVDGAIVEAITARLNTRVPAVPTGVSIGKLAAILKRAALCISNDSGPRHLAIAVGTPSLALFRQHHDREWGVYAPSHSVATVQGGAQCSACPAGVCEDRLPPGETIGSYCMRMIEVDDVLTRAAQMLASP